MDIWVNSKSPRKSAKRPEGSILAFFVPNNVGGSARTPNFLVFSYETAQSDSISIPRCTFPGTFDPTVKASAVQGGHSGRSRRWASV